MDMKYQAIFGWVEVIAKTMKSVEGLALRLGLSEDFTVDEFEAKVIELSESKPFDFNGELKDIEKALDCAHDSIYEVESAADEIKGYGRSLHDTKQDVSSSLEDITMALRQIKERQAE